MSTAAAHAATGRRVRGAQRRFAARDHGHRPRFWFRRLPWRGAVVGLNKIPHPARQRGVIGHRGASWTTSRRCTAAASTSSHASRRASRATPSEHVTRCRRRLRPRCASAARSGARARSRPGSGASCSTLPGRTCAGASRRSTTTSRPLRTAAGARCRAARGARAPAGAAADRRLSPLLRGPRLRGDRRGARDPHRNRRRDPQCSARGAS